MNRKAESLASNISSTESDNFQHIQIRNPYNAYQVSDRLERRITILDPKR